VLQLQNTNAHNSFPAAVCAWCDHWVRFIQLGQFIVTGARSLLRFLDGSVYLTWFASKHRVFRWTQSFRCMQEAFFDIVGARWHILSRDSAFQEACLIIVLFNLFLVSWWHLFSVNLLKVLGMEVGNRQPMMLRIVQERSSLRFQSHTSLVIRQDLVVIGGVVVRRGEAIQSLVVLNVVAHHFALGFADVALVLRVE